MSLLLIASIDVPVSAAPPATFAIEQVGTSARAFDGGLRSTVRAEKQTWTVLTGLMLQASVVTLLAAIADAAHVTVSGDLTGTITAEVTVGSQSPYQSAHGGDGLGFMRQLALTIREV